MKTPSKPTPLPVSAAKAGQLATPPRATLFDDVDILRAVVSELRDRVYQLGGRLVPVRDITPCPAPEEAPSYDRSHLGQSVNEVTGIANEIHRALNAINESLRLP